MHSLKCNFPLIGIVLINIKSNNLLEFTKRQLKNYIVSQSDTTNSDYFVSIKADDFDNLYFEDSILGRDVKFKDNKLNFIKNSRVQCITYNYDFNKNIDLSINFKKKNLYYLKSMLSSKYSINHSLFYETILYPIFSLYAIKDNYSLVHGSLIKIDDKYIVLAGLDGVGKSSLSNELVLQGAKILADNFVLFNGEKFIGLNMPIRLDLDNDTKENVIFEDNNLKEVLFDYSEDKAVQVDAVYFLAIGEKLGIQKIDQNIVNQNWNLINNGASEILGANMFNIPFLYQNTIDKTIKQGNCTNYIFSIPKGKIKEARKELICQLSI